MNTHHGSRVLHKGVIALCLGLFTAGAAASDWPARPIRIVNPASPGGTADGLTRIVIEKMAEDLGQSVILDFRAGANGIIGTDHVAKSAPDGYTLLLCNSATVTNAALHGKLPYDTERDLAPVSHFFETPYFLVVNARQPAATVAELLALARRSSGKLAFASSGIGSTPHLTGEQLALKTGVPLLHVPYKGSAPAVTAVVAGEAQFLFMSLPATRTFIDEGKLRVLATTMPARSPFLPQVPTMIESGVADFTASAWFGLCAPAGTPAAVQSRIADSLGRALASPDVRQRFLEAGAMPVPGTPDAFRAFFERSLRDTAAMLKALGTKID